MEQKVIMAGFGGQGIMAIGKMCIRDRDVEFGHELTKKVSWETDIPIRYEAVIKETAEKIKNQEILEKLFLINLYMREEWMS